MGNWLKITILLSSIGFLRDFRPSDAFIFVYLTGSWKHFSNDQVNQHIFPIGAYSNAICLIAMFFLTDICRYKPLIILMGFAGTVTWSLLIWSETLQAMQFAEVHFNTYLFVISLGIVITKIGRLTFFLGPYQRPCNVDKI